MKKISLLMCVLFLSPWNAFATIKVKQHKVKHTSVTKHERTTKIVQKALPKKEPSQKETSKEAPKKAQVITPAKEVAQVAPEKETLSIKTEKVSPIKVTSALPLSAAAYPTSSAYRPLVVPRGLLLGQGTVEYHYFTPGHLGANLILESQYSHFQDWEFTGEVSAFPQTQKGFEFGGIRTGFLYQALTEDNENPEIALGAKLGFAGSGIYSLTKNNTFAVFPNVAIKKQLINHLSAVAELMAGIGNREAGLASLNVGGIYNATQDIDFRLKLDLENMGYSFDEVISLTPAMEYHLLKNLDVLGGVQIGLLGANQIGNNFFVGVTSKL